MSAFGPEDHPYCEEANAIARLPHDAARHERETAFCKTLEQLRVKNKIDQHKHRALVAIADLINDPRAHLAFEENVIDIQRPGQIHHHYTPVHHVPGYHGYASYGSQRRPA